MDHDKVERLFKRGFAYVGMIEECRMRCVLLKGKIDSSEHTAEFSEQISEEYQQIRITLNKYTNKLKSIRNELERHGVFEKLE